jgi:hypothetical protein
MEKIMANTGYNFREIRMVYAKDMTHCWVYLEAIGDCPLNVQGWHYKAFPITVVGERIFTKEIPKCIEWPLDPPKSWPECEKMYR